MTDVAHNASAPADAGIENMTSPAGGNTPRFEDILKIDVHTHLLHATPEMAGQMRTNSIRAVNICMGGTDPDDLRRQEKAYEELSREYGDVFAFASTFDLTRCDAPDYADRCIAWLDRAFEAGALMTKVWKDVGMKATTRDGDFLLPDDPVFDPIYAHLAKRDVPLLIHCGDIKDVWEPLTPDHLFYTYFAENPEWHMYGKERVPSYDTLIAARDRLIEKHPDLTIIGAHLGSMSRDLDALGTRLDEYANFHVDCSARTVILSREPVNEVREFFMRYHDRILYGTDFMTLGEDEPRDNELLEFVLWSERMYRAEYQYYAGTGTVAYWGMEVECLGLPVPVVEDIYSRNALRLVPRLSRWNPASDSPLDL